MKILIQTALSLEFDAVRAFVSDPHPVRHPVTGSMYLKGTYNGKDVLLVETGAGNVRAADETGRAINFFRPDYVFFVGVAGGIKDVTLGDVVASSKVIGYEMGKDDIEFKPRQDTVQASYQLEQIAKHILRERHWVEKIKIAFKTTPIAFVQPIAAGEKVVTANRSVSYAYLKKYCSDAVAVDMEGNGFLIAARPYSAQAIEIRGISDLIENKAEADATGSQPKAAAHAAAFCFAMIDEFVADSMLSNRSHSLEYREKLLDQVVELYPQGPEQDNIWKRAGGDVSILSNASSRRSQWYNAIDKLLQGGGGKAISLTSLFVEIKKDFPQASFDLSEA